MNNRHFLLQRIIARKEINSNIKSNIFVDRTFFL